jgi:hypothetical protein
MGLTREPAPHARLMRLAREVGARVPCERATVQSDRPIRKRRPAAVTPGGSTPTSAHVECAPWALTRERATHARLMRLARRGWGPGAMRMSHGAIRPSNPQRRPAAVTARWVDPHCELMYDAHHGSDPRAGYTRTAHAACA